MNVSAVCTIPPADLPAYLALCWHLLDTVPAGLRQRGSEVCRVEWSGAGKVPYPAVEAL